MLEFALYYFVCQILAAQIAASTPLSGNSRFSFKIRNSAFACSPRIVLGYSVNDNIAYNKRAGGNLACFTTLE